jgi:hypothetical protein
MDREFCGLVRLTWKKKLDILIWMFFSFHLSISSWLWIELYNFFLFFFIKLSGQSSCIFFYAKKHINNAIIFFNFKNKKIDPIDNIAHKII